MFGVQKETTSDVGGGQNVGFIDIGDWMSYPAVTIPSAGAYKVEYQVHANVDVSSPNTPTKMSFFAINTAGGYVAKYLGAVFKHGKPAERNFKMLKLGDKMSCTIDLGKLYEFASGSDDNSLISAS